MLKTEVYRELALRTGGSIYIGVVGPVRTGKSTLIKRFMETLVLPEIQDVYQRERAKDELPQSGSGRTIMTAEPKFVPEQPAELDLGENTVCRVRMVDSVGYLVQGAAGAWEDGRERMVMTPWYEEEIPLSRAAEEGTRRVIAEHSTIGLLVTTDGSICGIDRGDYVQAEARAATELNALGKPYLILLNSAHPDAEETQALAKELGEAYGHRCLAVNCLELDADAMLGLLRELLFAFPVAVYALRLPAWLEALPLENQVKQDLFQAVLHAAESAPSMGQAGDLAAWIAEQENVQSAQVERVDLASGTVILTATLPQTLYYRIISEESGFHIANDRELLELLRSVSSLKEEYERVHLALEEARETGYGIVMPTLEEMQLEEPQIVRQGGRYGVKLKASAPSIHMIMADIETEVSPAIGGEKASEEVINFLLQGYDGDINRIWESNIFGKALNDIAGEGLTGKIRSMPEDAKTKLRGTIRRIVNEGSGGLICILL